VEDKTNETRMTKAERKRGKEKEGEKGEFEKTNSRRGDRDSKNDRRKVYEGV